MCRTPLSDILDGIRMNEFELNDSVEELAQKRENMACYLADLDAYIEADGEVTE